MKRKLALLLSLLALVVFVFAACGECEHVDSNTDGVCDTCTADMPEHTHTYELTYTTNETHHWYASTCAHNVVEKTEHTMVDGACSVCAYAGASHQHTYEEAWTTDADYHWLVGTCHSQAIADKAEHVDENKDAICDVCEFTDESHEHEFDDTEWLYDATNHWYAADCEDVDHSGVKGSFDAHVDEDSDVVCDTCQVNIVKAAIEQGAANDSMVKYGVTTDGWYLYGEDFVIANDDGARTYNTLVNGKLFCVYITDEGYIKGYETDVKAAESYKFSASWADYDENVVGFGAAGLLDNLYTIVVNDTENGSSVSFDAEAGTFTINAVFVPFSKYDITAVFTLDKAGYINSINITSLVYAFDYETNAISEWPSEYNYSVAQYVDDVMAPVDPEEFLFDSFDLADENDQPISDTINIVTGSYNYFGVINALPESASFDYDELTVTVTDAEGNVTESLSASYGSWNNSISMYSYVAGTYTVKIASFLTEKTYTVVVTNPPVTALTPMYNMESKTAVIAYLEGGLAGGIVSATANNYANQNYTASLPAGTTGATLVYNADNNNYVFAATVEGTYVVTFVSEENADITATLTIEVKNPPAVSDILNGKYIMAYRYMDYDSWTEVSVKEIVEFVPESDGATAGTIKIGATEGTYTYDATTKAITVMVGGSEYTENVFLLSADYELQFMNNNAGIVVLPEYTAEAWITVAGWASEAGEEGRMGFNPYYSFTFNDDGTGYAMITLNPGTVDQFTVYPDFTWSIDESTNAITFAFTDNYLDSTSEYNYVGENWAGVKSVVLNADGSITFTLADDSTVVIK